MVSWFLQSHFEHLGGSGIIAHNNLFTQRILNLSLSHDQTPDRSRLRRTMAATSCLSAETHCSSCSEKSLSRRLCSSTNSRSPSRSASSWRWGKKHATVDHKRTGSILNVGCKTEVVVNNSTFSSFQAKKPLNELQRVPKMSRH